jgi:hypothetical protein
MRILVACERTGKVRDAFRVLGHDAISCDLKPSLRPGPHYQGDVRDIINTGFDLMVAHPPCTHLAVSGARHFEEKRRDGRQQQAIDFFMEMVNAPIPKIAIENPVGIMSTLYREPDQYIQPWQYGHGETKKTCLWLKNLPPLIPTNIVPGREQRIHNMPPSEDRADLRSITYDGWALAMAGQWAGNMTRQATLEIIKAIV